MEMLYSQKILKKTFQGTSVKDAYMKAVKWYASNIIAKNDLHDIQAEFKKNETAMTVEMCLYAVLSADEIKKQHCECCREIHKSFFINEANNCNECKIGGYERRMKMRMDNKISYYKELLKKEGLI